MNKKCLLVKYSKIKGIFKLDDVNDVGGKYFLECILILIEGDFVKLLVVFGLGVIGWDRYGVFLFRGKIFNVWEVFYK